MVEDKVWTTKLTPQAFLERSAKAFGDREAVVYGSQRYTYSQLLGRVNRLASALIAADVHNGDRVAFLAPNVPALVEAHFAVPLAGAILVPINIRLSAIEVEYIINHAEPKALFVDAQFVDLVELALKGPGSTKVVTILDDQEGKKPDGLDYNEFLRSGSDESIEWAIADEEDLISINYTSGTTGKPKGVMVSHRGAYLQALGVALEMDLASDSRYLWTLPMFHCNGWCCGWAVTAVGGVQVCLRRPDPETVWDLLLRERITHFCGAPTVLTSLINHPAGKEGHLSHKVRVVTAGAPPSPTLLAQVEAVGIEVIHQYGLTETYGPYTSATGSPGGTRSLPVNGRG